ncbi:ISKra4 family transposase [Roseicella aerolata]|uniref:ISKra4 family transposase n=1 Tax=Roseicella aerolata TaxID=2883479 RepID=A0A9X1LCZ1_9PROT|nr:ISKra4 family transposase [Roseicella aerolata]MCB4824573.1 ISKra4 family transposase [Roseicella aerolata]
MTMRFTLTLTAEADGGAGRATERSVVAVIERDVLVPETLGLTLAEAKEVLGRVQEAVAANQVAAHAGASRRCAACGIARRVRGHCPLTCRTAFGTVRIAAERLRRCACGADPAAGNRASFSPLADLLPERTTPELLYLETRWGSLVSYGMAARLLGDVLPLERPIAPEQVRRHLHAVAAREEDALRNRPDGAPWTGCQRDLDALPAPDGPAYVGVDGGFVRDRAGSWFEVIAGKYVPGFRRDASEDAAPRPAKCFAFVQAHDDRPRRRLTEVLASQGHTPNQRVVLMSDGGDSVRRLLAHVGPEAEHVLDWFHVTMRLTVLAQMTKGTCPDRGWTEARLRDLERLKWLLWHGHARHAVEAASGFADDAWGMEGDAEGEAKAKLGRLHRAGEEFATYLRNNAGQIIDYGERHRAGERISTGFVESAVNQIVSKRFSKRQSMRWTQRGAHLTLQARTRVLNGELEDAFRRRWPAFRLSPPPASAAENCSFGLPLPPTVTPPPAHVS